MADTDALDFTRSELMTASSDDSELESEDSFASRSYEEEGQYPCVNLQLQTDSIKFSGSG